MASLADYFAKESYKPKYFIGDRVCGKWNGIPFVGTVGNDSQIGGPDTTPLVYVILDLPIVKSGVPRTVISVEHKHVKVYK